MGQLKIGSSPGVCELNISLRNLACFSLHPNRDRDWDSEVDPVERHVAVETFPVREALDRHGERRNYWEAPTNGGRKERK